METGNTVEKNTEQCNRGDCKDLIRNLTEERDVIKKKYDLLDVDFKELQLKENQLTQKLEHKDKKLSEKSTKIKQLDNKVTKQEGTIEALQKVVANNNERDKFTDSDRKKLNYIEENSKHIVQMMGEKMETVNKNIIQNRMSTNIGEKLSKWGSKVTLIGKKDEMEKLFSNHWVLQKDLVKLEKKGVMKKESVEVTGSFRMEEALYMKIGDLQKKDGKSVAIVLLDGLEPDQDLSGKIATNRINSTTETLQEVLTELKTKFSDAIFLSAAVGKAKNNKQLFETAMIDNFGNAVYSVVALNDGDAGLENIDGSWSPFMNALVFSSIYNIVAGSREEDISVRCLQCGLIHDKEGKCWNGLTFEEDCVVCGLRHEGAGKYCGQSTKTCRYCLKVGHLKIIHTRNSAEAFKEKVRREYGSKFEFVSLDGASKEQGGNETKKRKASSSSFSGKR